MVSSRQRQRQLARERYERQQTRRRTRAKRQRVISIVVGTIVALIVVAALGWLVLRLVDEDEQREPVVPTPGDPFSTDLKTPSSNVPTTTPGEQTGSLTSPTPTETPR